MQLTLRHHPVFIYTAGQPIAPDRPSILFLHGAANDHSVWAHQSRWFAHHGYNALAVDLPGHGRSGGEALASIALLADWAAELIVALQLKNVFLVGHSMGSLMALELAFRAPSSTAGLALIGCAVPMNVSDALLAAARDDEASAIDLINAWSHTPATLLGGGPLPGMWLAAMNRALMARAGRGTLHRDLLNCREYDHGLEAARNIHCPTLLLSGERDLMTPRKAAAALLEALPNAREFVVAACGHAMMNEGPESVLEALKSFFSRR